MLVLIRRFHLGLPIRTNIRPNGFTINIISESVNHSISRSSNKSLFISGIVAHMDRNSTTINKMAKNTNKNEKQSTQLNHIKTHIEHHTQE